MHSFSGVPSFDLRERVWMIWQAMHIAMVMIAMAKMTKPATTSSIMAYCGSDFKSANQVQELQSQVAMVWYVYMYVYCVVVTGRKRTLVV